ncbi:hypothetical protein Hanom_Chr14g01277871 [Helianthus anomalus]
MMIFEPKFWTLVRSNRLRMVRNVITRLAGMFGYLAPENASNYPFHVYISWT